MSAQPCEMAPEYEDIQTRTSNVSGDFSTTVFMTCTTRPSDSTTSWSKSCLGVAGSMGDRTDSYDKCGASEACASISTLDIVGLAGALRGMDTTASRKHTISKPACRVRLSKREREVSAVAYIEIMGTSKSKMRPTHVVHCCIDPASQQS